MRSVTLVVPDTDVVPRSVGGRSGRFLWTAADHLLVTSERGRRRLVDEGGAPEDRVELPGRGRHTGPTRGRRLE